MAAVYIDSLNNPLLKEFRRLLKSRRYRYKQQQIALEGPNLIEEALKAGLIPTVVFYGGDYNEDDKESLFSGLGPEVKRVEVAPHLFKKISDTENPQPVAAIVPFNPEDSAAVEVSSLQLVLLLDRIQDPGNMGTIIRTAAAAGVDALYYTSGSVDPYSQKVLRATAGTIFSLPIELIREPLTLIRNLKRQKMQLVAADAHSDQAYWSADYRQPTVLIIGNEAAGISPELIEETDFSIAIPLAENIDSLNASIAAGVILYEIIRQRRT